MRPTSGPQVPGSRGCPSHWAIAPIIPGSVGTPPQTGVLTAPPPQLGSRYLLAVTARRHLHVRRCLPPPCRGRLGSPAPLYAGASPIITPLQPFRNGTSAAFISPAKLAAHFRSGASKLAPLPVRHLSQEIPRLQAQRTLRRRVCVSDLVGVAAQRHSAATRILKLAMYSHLHRSAAGYCKDIYTGACAGAPLECDQSGRHLGHAPDSLVLF